MAPPGEKLRKASPRQLRFQRENKITGERQVLSPKNLVNPFIGEPLSRLPDADADISREVKCLRQALGAKKRKV